jgi:hypothetical protein
MLLVHLAHTLCFSHLPSHTILGNYLGKNSWYSGNKLYFEINASANTVQQTHIFLTDIVYKTITFRIDEYLIVRKHCFTASEC